HEFYSGKLMPMGARLVSRDRTGAYDYLPKSVASFIDAAQMCDCLRSAGFASVSATPLTFGVVTVYVATKESR
ncbi:MAG: class I SAM-dependent methyltransferase, partial [Planctomycetes bacterium]|nr:class I SAM-dependent methyltransferase [Planctomycetota bacterium]